MNYIFISWWNPFNWIKDSALKLFYFILIMLNSIIYSFISFVYQIFLTITSNEGILDDSVINGFVDRLYIIIGVVTLFIVAYSLLKTMINPDEALKGKKSSVNIIKDVIISIALITLLPTIFDFAFAAQNSILQYNTIGKLMLGTYVNDSGGDDTIKGGGKMIASTVWQSFFYPDDKYCTIEEEKNGTDRDCEPLPVEDGKTWGEVWEEADSNSTFFGLTSIIPAIVSGDVTYLFVFDTLVGLYVLFVLGIYCMDMAVRLVKLSVYQIIAPLPILARIVPNESVGKVFNNWLKATISTFVEVFIRVALLFFAVIVIQSAIRSIDNVFTSNFSGTAGPMIKGVAQILIIIGIVKFTKEAPAIIKELTGLDGGKYGKSLINGAGMLLGGLGTAGTNIMRNAANHWDRNKGFRENMQNQWRNKKDIWRDTGHGFATGAWAGRKADKFGDIPGIIGKTSSASRARRRNIEQQHGKPLANGQGYEWQGGWRGALAYQKAVRDLRNEKIDNWFKGDSASEDNRALQALEQITKLLDQAEEVWKKDPGYIKAKEEYQQSEGKLNKFQKAVEQATEYSGQNVLDSLNHSDQNIRNNALAMVENIAQSTKGVGYTDTKNKLDQKQKELEENTKEFEEIILSTVNGKDILNHLKHTDPAVRAQALAEANRIMQAARGVDYSSLYDLGSDVSDLRATMADIEQSVKNTTTSVDAKKLLSDLQSKDENVRRRAEFQAEMVTKDLGSYIEIARETASKKADLKGAERYVRQQPSKASASSSLESQAQNLMEQYSDLAEYMNISVLEGTSKQLSDSQKAAVAKYDAIKDPNQKRDTLQADLRAGSQEAFEYMDAYNNLKDHMKDSKTEIINRINNRKAKEEQVKKEK